MTLDESIRNEIAIVGAGVSGLTCAHELAIHRDVTVFYDQDVLATTSALATAIWHVYLVDPDDQQNLDWSQRTLVRLLDLCSDPTSGVSLCEGVELFRTSPEHRPPWADIAKGFHPLTPEDLLQYPGRTWGYRIAAPAANMHKYLGWLRAACDDRNVRFVRRHVSRLTDVLDDFPIVVNCSGLGARELAHDEELYPVRGQYLVLRPNELSPHTYVGDDEHPDGMAYVIPRDNELMVGGTEEPDEASMQFVADKEKLLRRAGEFWPQDLTTLEELRAVVGLRPCRRSMQVRFGRDSENQAIIHNYGHGGSGFSLSWGCAEDVTRLALTPTTT